MANIKRAAVTSLILILSQGSIRQLWWVGCFDRWLCIAFPSLFAVLWCDSSIKHSTFLHFRIILLPGRSILSASVPPPVSPSSPPVPLPSGWIRSSRCRAIWTCQWWQWNSGRRNRTQATAEEVAQTTQVCLCPVQWIQARGEGEKRWGHLQEGESKAEFLLPCVISLQ